MRWCQRGNILASRRRLGFDKLLLRHTPPLHTKNTSTGSGDRPPPSCRRDTRHEVKGLQDHAPPCRRAAKPWLSQPDTSSRCWP